MYLTFECGICSSLYQIQAEKFSNSLQKVVCPSCQNFHYFSATQSEKKSISPTIEKIMDEKSQTDHSHPKVSQRSNLSMDLFWKCGVCESEYHFNLDRVSAQGIKVTCSTCFNFFILQKISDMVDLDHLIMHDVATKNIPSTVIKNPEKRGFLPPPFEETEISGRFDLDTLQSSEKNLNSKVIPLPVLPELQKEKNTSEEKQHLPKVEEKKPHNPQKIETKPIEKKPETIKKNESMNMMHSFVAFNTKRSDFKIDKDLEHSSIVFIENIEDKSKNSLKKNITTISFWIAIISTLLLTSIFIYDWIESKNKKNIPEIETIAPVESDPSKPKYGFPELGE